MKETHNMEHIDVNGIRTVQFDEYDVDRHDWSKRWPYGFAAAMVRTCAPLLDDCDDNYDVTAKLKAAKVISRGNGTDPESCCTYVYFRDKRMGLSFIRRLNKYLVKKAEALAAVKTQRRAVAAW